MKNIILILLSLTMFGCAQTSVKRAAEIVPSCFSDGENQELYCKAQRTNEEGKTVITRCIGKENREAAPNLRGKCVEKICSEGSNTDCHTRGEFAVLQQYADLMTSGQFGSDDGGTAAPAPAKKMTAMKEKGKKGKMAKATTPAVVASTPSASQSLSEAATTEVDTDPTAKLAALPTPAPEPTPIKKAIPKEAESAEPPQMAITLKPAKASKKKARATASVKAYEEGFKKVCIEKGDTAAPEVLRGKCATRNCASGKCSYKGRKEMFEWVAKSASND
ncbi:hypothetical protein [Bdellovibrio sp. HCB337]|uniref:hypothetical protein n=1 Tax=Bdellovibrio sp. HCB337 TaxID=3394358 RepID=UPI0039A66C1A